jgi:hypothetical protein
MIITCRFILKLPPSSQPWMPLELHHLKLRITSPLALEWK